MQTLKLDKSEDIAIVRLNRGKANAMNAEMVNELSLLINELSNDDQVRGIVLTGKENFFSAGLDVIELFSYDEQQITAFWQSFQQLTITLASFTKPFITAINGHSPAGGCVLALCSDYRIMADGNFRIGLNEVPVGILVPNPIFQLYSFWLGTHHAYHFILEGKLLLPADALQAGLIDQICPIELLEEQAVSKLAALLKFDQTVWKGSKLNFRRQLIQQLSADFDTAFAATLKHWWAPESRLGIQQMIAGLKKN
jgi:enoyl-CoA hydratase/carnithine racemase